MYHVILTTFYSFLHFRTFYVYFKVHDMQSIVYQPKEAEEEKNGVTYV